MPQGQVHAQPESLPDVIFASCTSRQAYIPFGILDRFLNIVYASLWTHRSHSVIAGTKTGTLADVKDVILKKLCRSLR